MSRCAHGTLLTKRCRNCGADDAAGRAVAGDVLDVGGVAVDRPVVGVVERQAPQFLANRLAGGGQPLGQLVVVGEEPGMLVAERDDDRAGQGRQIDHQRRLEAVLAVPQRVGEHEPALGVGVQHLDRLARTSSVTMSPGRCAEPDGMFSTSPTTPTALTLALRAGEQPHQPDHHAGAGHVPFHVAHAGGRLDRDAAGVEGHALADKGERRRALGAAVPAA